MEHFDEWKKSAEVAGRQVRKDKDWDAVIKEGTAIRDMYPDYVEERQRLRNPRQRLHGQGRQAHGHGRAGALSRRSAAAIPESLKQLAKTARRSRPQQEAADALKRLNFIYPEDDAAHSSLGGSWLVQGNAKGAIREYQAVLAPNPHRSGAGALRPGPGLQANNQDRAGQGRSAVPLWKPRPDSSRRRSSC